MKSIRATKPRVEVAQKVLHTIVELTESRPDFSIHCIFEYLPQAKACSVPDDATPCTRLPYNIVLCTIRWPEDTEENFKFARDASRKLVSLVAEANVELTPAENTGYRNYGAWFYGFATDVPLYAGQTPSYLLVTKVKTSQI